jgi:peptide/nickel transport system permease protein
MKLAHAIAAIRREWPRLSPSARIGAAMLLVFLLTGIFGPWLAPYDPERVDLASRFLPASGAHWLGTDGNGVDTLSQLLWGARKALEISGIVVVISATIGLTLGTVAGWYGGAVDEIIMRFVDILLSFPGILLNIAIVATVRNPGLPVVIAALCANGWVGYARVARGQVLALRTRDYVTAALALGASNRRVMFLHLIPNVLGPAFVQMTFGFGTIIMIEASLSFLGLGPQVDYTWGAMLNQGTAFLWKAGFRHYVIVPGLAISWVMLGVNLLGDGLRDRFDPRLRRRS